MKFVPESEVLLHFQVHRISSCFLLNFTSLYVHAVISIFCYG